MTGRPDYIKCIANAPVEPIPRYNVVSDTGEAVEYLDEEGDWVRFDDVLEFFTVHRNKDLESFCGRGLQFQWFFTGVSHAVRAAKDNDRLLICRDCLEEVHRIMLNHSEGSGDD